MEKSLKELYQDGLFKEGIYVCKRSDYNKIFKKGEAVKIEHTKEPMFKPHPYIITKLKSKKYERGVKMASHGFVFKYFQLFC